MDTAVLSPIQSHVSHVTHMPFMFTLESGPIFPSCEELVWTPTLTPVEVSGGTLFCGGGVVEGGGVDSHGGAAVLDEKDTPPTIDPALLSFHMPLPAQPESSTASLKRRADDECVDALKKAKVEPRSPSPPSYHSPNPLILRLTHRPAVHSPLTPFVSEYSPPPPRRRRSTDSIGLLKYVLDPWIRLSRALDPLVPSTPEPTPVIQHVPFPPPGLERVACVDA